MYVSDEYPKKNRVFNEELGQKILDQITAHPESWEQASWGRWIGSDCGTIACVAGWAVHFTGWKSNREIPQAHVVSKGDRVTSVQYAAQDELGLTDRQSEYLFGGGRDLGEIEEFLLKPEARVKHDPRFDDDE